MSTLEEQRTQSRIHYLSVAISRHVFQHPKYGIVFVKDPISTQDALKFDLSPTLIYSIKVAETKIYWDVFSPASSPLSLLGVLNDAWNTKRFRGYPDVLIISRHLDGAHVLLSKELENIGVKVQIASGHDRKFPTAIRTAQTNSLSLYCYHPKSIDHLNKGADNFHQNSIGPAMFSGQSKTLRLKTESYLQLASRHLVTPLTEQQDWLPGKWLYSWESTLPTSPDRYFNVDNERIFLLSNYEEAKDIDDTDDDFDDPDVSFDAIRSLVECWPSQQADIALSIGITLRDLTYFLRGKKNLTHSQMSDLMLLLTFESNDYSYYEPEGPCILLASTLRSTVAAYDALSHGGDLEFSFEIAPEHGDPDPSYRYVIFNRFAGDMNILMVPREGAVAEKLNSSRFINLGKMRKVDQDFYKNVVSTCAKGSLHPNANLPAIEQFISEYQDYIDSFNSLF